MARRARKEAAGTKTRIQVVLDSALVAEMDDLAGKMNMSRSFFAATLIQDAMADTKWMYKFILSPLGAPIRALSKRLHGKDVREMKEQYERLLKEMENAGD